MPPAPTSLAEALRERYPIEGELGRGGMATVYRVRDARHGRCVALKVLHPELAEALGPEERFLREIRLTAGLQHPHILPVFDSGEAAGQLWYTMPVVEGESLRQRLRRDGSLPVREALRITREVAEALDYAHSQGVIHRDIKPENILLSRGHALVADFGVAHALGVSGGDKAGSTGLSLSIGTPAYLSPEQARGSAADSRCDIYSLGCVLYEMLAGEPLFSGATQEAIVAKRLSAPAPAIHFRSDVPVQLEATVRQALAESPADRFQTAAAFAVELARSEQPPEREHTSRLVAGAWVAGIAALVGTAGFVVVRRVSHETTASESATWMAVLPMAPMDGDSKEEYFADGMADAVRGKLAGLQGLRVIASSSSNEYRRTTESPQQIGQELGVRYILTGQMHREQSAGGKDRFEVRPELVEASTGAIRWQQSFEAPVIDVFRVQADIAEQAARAMHVGVSAGERRRVAEEPTRSVAAYDAFLHGEAVSAGMAEVSDPTTVARAIDYYHRAVTFDSAFTLAWMRLAQAHAALIPQTSQTWKASLAAADNALALAPSEFEGRLALGDYYYMERKYRQALDQYALGRRAAPRNVELLVGTAMSEQSLGRWDESVQYLTEAQALDPRSVKTAWRRAQTLYSLRRYPEALAACDQGLAFAPASLELLEFKAMVYLAQGDLTGARLIFQSAPREVAGAPLVSYVASMFDLVWVLDAKQQALLLRLDPAIFGNRAIWALVLAQTYALHGDRLRVRAYADSARAAWEDLLRDSPDDGLFHVLYGLSLAYMGRRTDAIREGELGVSRAPIDQDQYIGAYIQHQLARIYLLVGDHQKALDLLEPLLTRPYVLSPGWLRIDPTFDALRGDPRFARLAGQNGSRAP